MANVLLLRAHSKDEPDRYENAVRDVGYAPLSVPVLETALTNQDVLRQTLRQGPNNSLGSGRMDGVITTSARACEAWRAVVQELTELGPSEVGDWSKTIFYVVGTATTAALHEIATSYPKSSLAPRDVRGGAETGSAEKLAHFILKDLTVEKRTTRLLYLTGDKNRDTLPSILGEQGVSLETLQVYETRGSKTFRRDLIDALETFSTQFDRWWIVYFAPSAAEFVTPTLACIFDLPWEPGHDKLVSDDCPPRKAFYPARLAAIGSTTASYVQDTLHLEIRCSPAKPTPEELMRAIVEGDREDGQGAGTIR